MNCDTTCKHCFIYEYEHFNKDQGYICVNMQEHEFIGPEILATTEFKLTDESTISFTIKKLRWLTLAVGLDTGKWCENQDYDLDNLDQLKQIRDMLNEAINKLES